MKGAWSFVLAALVATLAAPARADDSPTTVMVYVPGYRSGSWQDLAGSVITSDSTATTYTVFCTDSDDCMIAGLAQFAFAEGPSTFKYSGQATSMWTAEMACALESTTAATCTEYTSYYSGYRHGNKTGPTELTQVETYSGSEVQWGALTLTSTVPAATAAQATDGSGLDSEASNTAWFFPAETKKSSSSAGVRGQEAGRSAVLVGVVAMVTSMLAVYC